MLLLLQLAPLPAIIVGVACGEDEDVIVAGQGGMIEVLVDYGAPFL